MDFYPSMHRPLVFDPPWIDFFHNPCPYWRTRHETFPQFKSLPIEIQLMIWEHALPDKQTVTVHLSKDNPHPRRLRAGVTPLWVSPTTRYLVSSSNNKSVYHMMQACFLSRKVTSKHYSRAFGRELGRSRLFDFKRDILKFKDEDSFDIFSETLDESGTTNEDLEKVKRLVIYVEPHLKSYHLIDICMTFPTMEKLVIIEEQDNHRQKTAITVHSSMFATQWHRSYGAIMTEMKDVFPDIGDKWTPPQVILGSAKQHKTNNKNRKKVQSLGDPMDWQLDIQWGSFEYERFQEQHVPKLVWKKA